MCMGLKSLGKSSIAGPGTRYLKKKYDKEMEPERVKPQKMDIPDKVTPKTPKAKNISSLQISKDY